MRNLLLCTLTPCAIFAQQVTYQASLDNAMWEIETSPTLCRLSHDIPGYGEIIITKDSGYHEKALLRLGFNRGITYDRAELSFIPPEWQPHQMSDEGWKFQFGRHGMPIEFSDRQTRVIIDHLARGLQPVITHRENYNRTEEVKAVVSLVSFKNKYDIYSACQREMIPVSFDEVKKSSVYFETGSVRVDEVAKIWLSYVLEYAKDPNTRRIELGGYTDSVGSFRANHKLASARVEVVRDHLIKSGFDEKKIRLKVYGEQRAVYKNTSREGRRKNRRVEIKMYR